MPVMKNEFDIYKGRQRRVSECSNQSGTCRSRKVSESSRSDCPSLSTSPGNDFMAAGSPARHRSHPMYMSHLASRPQFSRSASRNSQSSLVTSPTKAASASSSSPPKPATGSQSSLSSFHSRLVDKLRKSLRKSKSSDGGRSWEGATIPNTEPPDADTDQQQDEQDGGADDDEAELVLSDSVLHVTSKPPLPHRSSTTSFRNNTTGSGRHRSRRGTLSAPR